MIVPNITSTKQKRTKMSNIDGREIRMVDTKLDMPGIELIVLSGLKILMTLMADTFWSLSDALTQPAITTKKSRTFQASLMYEY